ncbi:MAG: hypothetical protein Kow0090_22260 [Myxococcota bacterium]
MSDELKNRKLLGKEISIVTAISVVLVAVFSHIPANRELSGTLVAFSFLAIPFAAIFILKLDISEIGLSLANWRSDLKLFAFLSLIVFPLYSLLYIPFQAYVMLVRATPKAGFFNLLSMLPDALTRLLSGWEWKLMDGWHLFIIAEIIATALPEELFFRGYLQGRLEGLFSKRQKLFGAEVSLAIVVAAAIFALMHIVSMPNPQRLGVFFPALIFGFLRARTGSILSAILFHSAANIYTSFMDYCAFAG